MAARRCSLLSARQLRPIRDSAPVMRRPGRPRRRGSRVCGAIPAGHCMRRRYGYLPESGGLLDTAAATRFPALVPRSNPAVARVAALGALAVVAVAAVVILFVRGAAPPSPDEAIDPFVAAWSRGDDRGAAALTSDPRGRRGGAGRQPPRPRRRPRAGQCAGRGQERRHGARDGRACAGRARDRRVVVSHAGRARAPRRALEGRLGAERDPPAPDRRDAAWAPCATPTRGRRSSTARAGRSSPLAAWSASASIAPRSRTSTRAPPRWPPPCTSTPPPSRAPPSAPAPSSSWRP